MEHGTQLQNLPVRQSKPPYLLGLLCIIPLIGAFVGLGLLLYAIFVYKNKWLAAIGISGIVFTIAVYGSMFYFMTHSDLSKEGFAEISKNQLTSLVGHLEAYKIKHGKYPDSLPQLLTDNKFAPIHDAVQGVQLRKNTLYNYQKVGDVYKLSSMGQDGIPNTKDDFYPEIWIDADNKGQ
ncbi:MULTISPECIES: type II secretion system protein GspG [Pedobacter]|uniref:type II secretion system protein GspG n=1 Tax=Pedobacter TaxID=84567 RepID=UPI002109B796|nr:MULTISPECIES: type II secretion system protein GspG [unclassified Pedobacter]